jgi:phosphoribosylformimino-5-aminoimidazole carboxamide ribotide isomerase
MHLYPAIDLRGGKVVQLVQGDFDRERVHGDDPVAVAQAFVAAGAPWIHTVDLDAARTGEPLNLGSIAAITAAVDVPVQAGGGVRSLDAAAALADVGVARVVMGTAALEDPALVARVAARQPVALGLDVKGREVAVRGWAEGSGVDWADALRRLADAGAVAVVVTQIEVEGLLGGPDASGLADVLAATDLDVIASGGVGSLDDLLRLAALERDGHGLSGAIVGTAIYEGRLDVADAVRALTRRRRIDVESTPTGLE